MTQKFQIVSDSLREFSPRGALRLQELDFNAESQHQHTLVIVGAGWAGQIMATALLEKTPNVSVVFLDDQKYPSEITLKKNLISYSVPVVGTSDSLIAVAQKVKAKGIIIAVTHFREDHLHRQIVECQEKGIPVYEMPEYYSMITKKIPVQHIRQHWIAPQLTRPIHDIYYFFFNAVNYFLCLFGLCLIIPFFPFIALAIKMDTKGHIFFKQERIGYNSRPFTLFKFRTMVKDADKRGTAWTLKGDRRITRVGEWLRKFRLDELPQLINVLKGEMALIGPRPEAVELVEKFKREIPFYEYRYLVKPGITGWAQVNYENTCSIEGALEKMQYDLFWIKSRSLLLDLKIIFKSIRVMITGFGAV